MDLFSRSRGAGAPLLLLHGLFGSGDNWFSLAGRMNGLEVHLPDLRCHGKSPRSDSFSVADLASDVAEYIQKNGLTGAIVAGHSLGAKVAMELALRHPDRVAGLVSLDMSPRQGSPRYLPYLEALEKLPLATLTSRRQAREALAKVIPEPEILAFLLKSLVQASNDTWQWLFEPAAIRRSFPEIWRGIEPGRTYLGPVLFLAGADSDYFLPDDVDPSLQFFPHAEFAAIRGARHWLHADKPDEVLGHLHQWITGSGLAELPEWI